MDKNLLTGATTILILKLLEEKDMYGYEMIETLAKRSDDTFLLKAGTLYSLLHNLEKQDIVKSYEEKADSQRLRKYYHLTVKGVALLRDKQKDWAVFSSSINKVLNGGASYVKA